MEAVLLALGARRAPRGDAVAAEDAADRLRVLRLDLRDVQPQLEAYVQKIRLELLGEVQFLRTFLAREIQLIQQGGHRPSF